MPAEYLVELDRVEKSYQLGDTQVHALRGINLKIIKSEFTALVGASGSGKSTLLNMVGCIDEPDSGTITVDGQSINSLSENEKAKLRNRKIGFVFQSFNLVPVLNVYENIELPLVINPEISDSEKKERIEQALKDVQLEKFAHHVPDRLSGGQRQRVAIARALVTQPALLLADEPTANLDSKTAHRIVDLLLDLNETRQVTFLFSTHDEKLMGRVKRTVRIQDGVIQE